MTGVSLRPILAPLAGAVMCFAAMQHPGATERGAVIEQFVGRAVSVSGPEDGGRVDIYIHRWSSDQELDCLREALTDIVPAKLFPALQDLVLQRPAGVVLMPGIQRFGARAHTRTPRNLLFAREVVTPTGRRLIAASDEHLGLGEDPLKARKTIEEFTALDIRIGKDGTGVGKLAPASDLAFDPATKSFDVKNYEAKPARLIDVKIETP